MWGGELIKIHIRTQVSKHQIFAWLNLRAKPTRLLACSLPKNIDKESILDKDGVRYKTCTFSLSFFFCVNIYSAIVRCNVELEQTEREKGKERELWRHIKSTLEIGGNRPRVYSLHSLHTAVWPMITNTNVGWLVTTSWGC